MGAGTFQMQRMTSRSYWPVQAFPCGGGNQPRSWPRQNMGDPREEQLSHPRAAGNGQGDVVGTRVPSTE